LLTCIARLPGGGWAARRLPAELRIHEDGSKAILWHLGERKEEIPLHELQEGRTPESLRFHVRYRPLTISVPAGWLLRRPLTLPAEAGDDLQQAIAFELDRFTPFEPHQVYFGARTTGGAPKEELLNVELVLVPRHRVQPWLETLQNRHIPVGRLTMTAETDSLNLLPAEFRPKLGFAARMRMYLPLLSIVAALVLAAAVPQWMAESRLQALRQEAHALKIRAREVMTSRQILEQRLARLERTAEQWRNTTRPLRVITLLSRLLPKDTYLQQLQIRDRDIVLHGISRRASRLIRLLQDSPQFTEAHFLSAVVQKNGEEQFHLAVTYTPARKEQRR
jgi:general secretion pathway protein L